MKKLLFLLAVGAMFTFTNCMKMDPVGCLATANPTTGKVGTSLSFTSCSTDAHHEEWDFGDAATATGTTVTHAYSKAGTFTVKLVAYNADKSKSDTKTSSITIAP
jgi:PKD repeat protein